MIRQRPLDFKNEIIKYERMSNNMLHKSDFRFRKRKIPKSFLRWKFDGFHANASERGQALIYDKNFAGNALTSRDAAHGLIEFETESWVFYFKLDQF